MSFNSKAIGLGGSLTFKTFTKVDINDLITNLILKCDYNHSLLHLESLMLSRLEPFACKIYLSLFDKF